MAFEVHKHSVSIPIESMACFGDNLFLGTRNGHLLTYHLLSANEKVEFKLKQHDHNFSSQAIIQIDTAPFLDYGLLFCLSNNVITVYKIDNLADSNVYSSYQLLHVADRTKGATSFAINKKKSADNLFVQVSVAIERKLHLYTWKRSQLQQFRNSIELATTPKDMMWYKDSICIGLSSGFSIYDVSLSLIYFDYVTICN